jgi:pimeloyl-ACP methyl ester carboxylesterase
VIGQGPALVALHGAATLVGQEFARGLADRFRVYLPFHPGFGDSAPAPHICGSQDVVVHTLNLMDALGLEKPHLMGHSMGGWMAAELAVVAGDRFGKLVLNAPAGLNDPAFPATDLGTIAHRIFRDIWRMTSTWVCDTFPAGPNALRPKSLVPRAPKKAKHCRIS